MKLVVKGTAPREIVPLMLDELEVLVPYKADWLKDVYSEVLRELRRDDVKDPEMVLWLCEALIGFLQSAAKPGEYFGRRNKDEWGFWPKEDDGDFGVSEEALSNLRRVG